MSGKGTRFILANTEQLHTKIHEMSERIRHLEEALETLHSRCTSEVHPLLQSEYLGIKSTMGLYGGGFQGAVDASSTPSENGHDHDPKSGPMEVDVGSHKNENSVHQVRPAELYIVLCLLMCPYYQFKEQQESTETLFAEVVRLSHSYPLPDNVSPEPNLPMREYIQGMLPDRSEAEYLWDQARQNALWQ